ncbi:DUF4826 family protein [Rheinheimera sp. MMS21-TC3]|uniref:DUF4826 family protein n=1 Tax=Rheinheimera sp. MMS21-TC3 TaxID=3072790 RepID=UPI0028C48C1B|nr:DUF4826 family protein [Rheinheimera sp. MMS21-TC3]WNO61263.1 DUF4826 family protein [Rheinheimera sp. MMS21-TC3]
MSEQLTQEQQVEQQEFEKTRAEWVRKQFQKANEYLASKGIVPDNVSVKESRYLPPYMAIWKLNTKQKQSYWVISGDLPTDHLAITAAENAREAVRSFSLQWQMKAQQIINAGIDDKTKHDFAQLLINRAEALYSMFEDEQLWQAEPV